MAKSIVVDKVQNNFATLGMQSIKEPLHMTTAIISPCRYCDNSECIRHSSEDYKVYSEDLSRLLDINSFANILGGNNPISFDSSILDNLLFAFVALPEKNMITYKDAERFKAGKVKDKYVGSHILGGVITDKAFIKNLLRLLEMPYAIITSRKKSGKPDKEAAFAKDKGIADTKDGDKFYAEDKQKFYAVDEESKITKLRHELTKILHGDISWLDMAKYYEIIKEIKEFNDKYASGPLKAYSAVANILSGVCYNWEVGALSNMQCELFPVRCLHPLTYIQEHFSGEVVQEKWVNIFYPGDFVYNGVFIPTCMYGLPLGAQAKNALLSYHPSSELV